MIGKKIPGKGMTLCCDTRDEANSANTAIAYDFHGFSLAMRKIRRNGAAQAAGGKSHLGDNRMKAAAVTTESPIRRQSFVFIFMRFLTKDVRMAFLADRVQEVEPI